MSPGLLDAVIRIGAITMILFLSWLLFRQRRQVGMPAWLLPPLALCLAGFLAGNTPDTSLRLSGISGTIAHLASGFTVVFLWWFCLSVFDRRFRVGGLVLAVGLLWALLAALDRGLFGAAAAELGWSRALVALGFAIVGHLIWRLAAERTGDLIQRRHDARIVVAVLLGGLLLVDLSADVLFGFAWRPLAFAMAQNLVILFFGLWLAGRLLTVRPQVLTFGEAPAGGMAPAADAPAADATAERGQAADDPLRRRLSALIEEERIFLDPELTFAGFVQLMEAPERVVRTLVNHELGFDHFRTFLNHYRMAEARRLLADPGRSGDKLIGVALDSGFASLASFNRVFRSVEGCTPSEFREACRRGDRPGPDAGEAQESAAAPGFEERSAVF